MKKLREQRWKEEAILLLLEGGVEDGDVAGDVAGYGADGYGVVYDEGGYDYVGYACRYLQDT